MTPTIYLALTHDWELRGDGSGDIEQIQFAPMRRLLAIYQKFGARTTFMPDVMQQIIFRKRQDAHVEIRRQGDRWDEHAREAYNSGHDIQLHLHSQWSDARYEKGRWQLNGAWSLLKYDRDSANQMIADSKRYLEELLQPINTQYRC